MPPGRRQPHGSLAWGLPPAAPSVPSAAGAPVPSCPPVPSLGSPEFPPAMCGGLVHGNESLSPALGHTVLRLPFLNAGGRLSGLEALAPSKPIQCWCSGSVTESSASLSPFRLFASGCSQSRWELSRVQLAWGSPANPRWGLKTHGLCVRSVRSHALPSFPPTRSLWLPLAPCWAPSSRPCPGSAPFPWLLSRSLNRIPVASQCRLSRPHPSASTCSFCRVY